MPIYALGSNGSGQLGLGHNTDTNVSALVPDGALLQDYEVKSIACGGNHTLLLTKSGHVFASGSNGSTICEPPSTNRKDTNQYFVNYPTFDARGKLCKIVICAATWDASIFVTMNGQVLVDGKGMKGELGLGEDRTTATTPQAIVGFPPADTAVVDLSACMGHVVAVLSNGEVFGWGTGRQGQLGSVAKIVWRPRRIDGISFKVVRAVCGKDFTCLFSHPDQGQMHFLGLEKRDKYNLKSSLPDLVGPWSTVQASWGGIYVLLRSGELLAWGRDDHGQLPPPDIPRLSAIAAGSEHVLALTTAGEALAWGWGEHGNCGLPLDQNCDVKARWNTLTESGIAGKVVGLGAGCATSWIVTARSGD